ncbi:hypothetical protein ABFA07_008589 [Porites harrisoni]
MTVVQVRLVLACTVAVYISLFRSPREKFPGEHHIKALRWDKVNTVEPPLMASSPQWQQPPKQVSILPKRTSLRWPVFSVGDEKVKTDASILDLSRQSHFDCVLFILLQLA